MLCIRSFMDAPGFQGDAHRERSRSQAPAWLIAMPSSFGLHRALKTVLGLLRLVGQRMS